MSKPFEIGDIVSYNLRKRRGEKPSLFAIGRVIAYIDDETCKIQGASTIWGADEKDLVKITNPKLLALWARYVEATASYTQILREFNLDMIF